jgi:hypothetical protein
MTVLRFLREASILGVALISMGMVLVPLSAQAACDGGDCPIVGGSLRTMVGGGFIIPQIPSVSPFAAPTGQMGFSNTAMGGILPVLGGSPKIVVPSGQVTGPSTPRSFTLPIGQLSYGSAPSNQPGTFPTAGYYTTPILVQVPIFGAVPVLFGVSTNIGQSFPGDVRFLPTKTPTSMGNFTDTLTINDSRVQTIIGGPGKFKAGGRSGASTVTNCAGAIVPDPIPGTWTGGCVGFTPTTGGSSMATGTQVVPALMRYTKTSNQFGGPASQRQVRRDATSTTNNWLGRINFNNFIAPYTKVQMDYTITADPTSMSLTPPTARKVYPTLPQNLIEPAAWGAGFGVVVQRLGATSLQGDLVSALLTFNGVPQNTSTVMITQNNPGAGGPGTGMGLVQTSTTWGGPLTTGMLTVQLLPSGTSPPPELWIVTGSDHRDSQGNGYVSLVSGSVSARSASGPGTQRTFLTLQVPEPAMAFGLVAGVIALAGLSRRRG